jgi:cytochrome d ubiquinol oxidase subunit II
MSYANLLLAVLWLAVTAYALLAGADFGAGFWDLLAGGARRGASQRSLIEHSIGPVWEANHVWLIFVLVIMWTAFPPLFAAISSTLYIPLTLIALGVIARGSAFAFRKVVTELWQRRVFGATFAFSSVVTPFFLGAVAGGVAAGRVPPGVGRGDSVTSWTGPVSILAGGFAVAVCAYLAAVYLTADARRSGDAELTELFRRRALATGVVAGGLAAAGLVVVHADAPRIFHGLDGRALPLLVLSIVAGLASMVLLVRRRFTAVRVSAALAVAAVLWGWAIAQYPRLLPGLTVQQAAAPHATLAVTTGCVAVGMALLVPSLGWLFVLFQRSPGRAASTVTTGE